MRKLWTGHGLGQLENWRRVIQGIALIITVYGGVLVGPYLADKISGTFPSLSCSFDKQNGAYCALISFQHQTHHQIGETLARGTELSLSLLTPLAGTLLSFLLFFLVLNKAFCGWICPLGTVQEGLFALGRRLGMVFHRLPTQQTGRVRPIKWLLLLFLVFIFPLLTGLGLLPHAFGDAFCRICPSRITTTLLTGDTSQLAMATQHWSDLLWGWLGHILFGFMVASAIVIRQPFCRICPMLAWHSLFRHLSPMRLSKPSRHTCGKCTLCYRACPMDIPEIASQSGLQAFQEECTLCGRCAEYCPRTGTIQLKFGPWPWFSSNLDYARQRARKQSADGNYKLDK